MNAAIIGISGYGRQHLLMAMDLALQGRLRLGAATVINQDEEAFLCARLRAQGCRIFDSADAMWAASAGQIDLCFIPTGIHLHARMTRQALRAGAHVLVEKPLAATVEEADEIAREEAQSGRRVLVGFQDFYQEATYAIKRLICGGELGALRTITVAGLWTRDAAYFARNRWAGRLRAHDLWVLDSPLNNAFAHFFNLALFWAGAEPAVSADPALIEGELYRARPIESFDTAAVRLTTATGATLGVYVTHSCPVDRVPRIVVQCERGRIDWVQESHYEIVRASRPAERLPLLGKLESRLAMADAALRHFDGDASAPVCGIRLARPLTSVVSALHQSCPICDVPARFLVRAGPEGEGVAIAEIEPEIMAAAARLALFSELPAPGAAPGGVWRPGDRPSLSLGPTVQI